MPQGGLIQRRRRASVRCAVTMHLAIIMECGPVRDAKLSSREAFKVTSLLHAQSCCSEYQRDYDSAASSYFLLISVFANESVQYIIKYLMADSLKKKATVATYWRIDVRISPLKYPVAPHAQKETFLSGELLRLTATVFRTQYVRKKKTRNSNAMGKHV